jgi:uncharacterized membrane protein
MMLANTWITLDPAWPWSEPGIGVPALVIVATVLVALTVWTYLGAKGANARRILVILGLRLAALVIACLVVLRPSLASLRDEDFLPSKIIIFLDRSASMAITDGFNNLSRWDDALRILQAPSVKEALRKLGDERRMEIVWYQGDTEVRPFNPEGRAEGKTTDMGEWLNFILQQHGRETNLRGLILLGDGADNGTRYSTLDKAALLRGVCPIYPFALGRPTTTSKQRDIAFDMEKIIVEPAQVNVKGKMTVKGYVTAPGFENARVTARLFLGDKEAAPAKLLTLLKTEGNEVLMTCDAPPVPGEVKVTLKVDPVLGEVTAQNNEVSTYATVSKEGVSILWVDRRRAFEQKMAIEYALKPDPRFRVTYLERVKEAKPSPDPADLWDFDKRHYDVIVIGDVSAREFARGNTGVFRKIRKLVEEKGTGLLMLGGSETFANSDWHHGDAADIAALLPVQLDKPGQVEGEKSVRVEPTDKGLIYILRLHDDPDKNKELWNKILEPLDGLTPLGTRKPTATVLATRDGREDEPVMVSTDVGEGRVLVFGGDTTWRAWRRSKEAVPAHARFWKQVMLWLAKQEKTDHAVWVRPDVRRLAAGQNLRLGLGVGLRGKGGADVPGAQFLVKVIGPDKQETEIPVTKEALQNRGYFWKVNLPGEYVIQVWGWGKDPSDGKEIPKTKDPVEARFLAYARDLENLRPAADHDFLAKLAAAGGGKFSLADERKLAQFLEELGARQDTLNKPKAELWPDWRRNPASDSVGDQLSTLWHSAALGCFLAFAGLLCVEWFLRRRWGMV